jgi:hypothetical protein
MRGLPGRRDGGRRRLTYGPSRCGIVTADGRSCELARGRDLIPASVQLFEGHHGLDDAAAAIRILPQARNAGAAEPRLR